MVGPGAARLGSMSEVTRDEFMMLRDQVKANAARIEAMDQGGTRGVAVVGVQVAEVIKDVADVRQELRAEMQDMRGQLAKHEEKHETEARSRAAARRWAWTFAAGAGAALAAILTVLVDVASHLH